uniref:C2H2-type domain-containing protein n=1 Tax=Cyprinodon variegatus TaxID=28743 RepID=A0A3Q2CBP3_CYPVA
MEPPQKRDNISPQSDGSINKPFSSSEFAEHFLHYCLLQKDTIDSKMGSSSLQDNTNFTEKKKVDSGKKLQEGLKFSCDDCGKIFDRKQNLEIHRQIHTGHKPYGCDMCVKRFGHKANLKAHIKVHREQKPFFCDVCGRRCNRKATLNRHMRVHTGEKPYCCDLCGQRFRVLNTHMRIHTGQKPFCCDLCGERFIRTRLIGSCSNTPKSHYLFSTLSLSSYESLSFLPQNLHQYSFSLCI